jgi:hypothetical protein
VKLFYKYWVFIVIKVGFERILTFLFECNGTDANRELDAGDLGFFIRKSLGVKSLPLTYTRSSDS